MGFSADLNLLMSFFFVATLSRCQEKRKRAFVNCVLPQTLTFDNYSGIFAVVSPDPPQPQHPQALRRER